MNLPEYDVNPKAEAGWAGVSVSVGTLLAAVLAASGVDPVIIGAASTLCASLTRIVIGHFLPAGKA